jgi:hypothetical protein
MENALSKNLLSDWQVNTIRFTVFLSPSTVVSGLTIWNKVVGEVPELKIENPRRSDIQLEGNYEKGKLVLKIEPVRIDWYYRPLEIDFDGTIGDFDEVLKTFIPLINKWLTSQEFPQVVRIAFGAILFYKVENRENGYQQLAEYLPNVKIDINKSSDFMYQINRPRLSQVGINGLKINRLSKWFITLVRDDILTSGNIREGIPLHFCTLELDINTSPDNKDEIPSKKVTNLINEMVEFGKEIALKGDLE